MKPNDREKHVIRPIIDFLELKGIRYFRAHPVRMKSKKLYNHVTDQYETSTFFVPVRASQKGAPDIFIFPKFNPPRFIAVETKSKKGTLSEEQIVWREDLTNIGAMYVVTSDPMIVLNIFTGKEAVERIRGSSRSNKNL